MMRDTPAITLINLNMLYIRYGEGVEHECHVPLGCLYLTRALEQAGFAVDFRDYQLAQATDPFDMESFLEFAAEPCAVIGLSCMANLLPFTILAARALKERYPDRTVVLGGVGPKGVEQGILERFPWIDIVCRGEAERTAVALLRSLESGGDLEGVAGLSFRTESGIRHTPDRARIHDLDALPLPAFEKVDLSRYAGYGMMTSRGCPYPCTFCSVAPVWNLESYSRSPESIVAEMIHLHERAGVDLFLFQDEFFVSGKGHVMAFCEALRRAGLAVEWKAFGRVNLVDEELMGAMADTGCIELRFGVESGSDRILQRIRKGFSAEQVLDLIPKAIEIFPRADVFYIWGFPFETMEDFNQTLFQMVSLRMLGARILPSLLSLLPQTVLYREISATSRLEFCPYLLPEFVFTGHEVCVGSTITIPAEYQPYFELIEEHPDLFPGFYHVDLETNVRPKLDLLREFGFYAGSGAQGAGAAPESCGAHSPSRMVRR